MRSSIALRASALVAAIVLTACPDPAPPTQNGTEPSPSPTATPEPTATYQADPFTDEDDVLDVAIKEPSTLDPMRIQDPGSFLVARQLYEGLTRWDPAEQIVVPGVAEGWTTPDSGRTWFFRLREGMSFHDGTPVTAQNFVFAFDRIAQKLNASELAYTLDRVVGFSDVNGAGTASHLAGLESIDDRTLSIRLTEPYQDLPAVLTHPTLVPLPKAAIDDLDTFLSSPVGNGPFQIAEPWAPGQPVVLRAFAGYFDTPELDGIRFLPYADAATSWIQFVRRELDVAEVPVGQIKAAESVYGSEGFKPLLAGYYYGLNLKSKNLRDVRIRRAVNRAIDRERIAADVFKGTLLPARGVVPDGLPGFEENSCTSLCSYSPAAARRALKGVPKRARSIALEFTKGEPHDQVAAIVRANLRAVGIKVSIRSYDFKQYLSRLSAGKQAMYRLGWLAEYPLADVFLWSLFASRSTDNHSSFASKRLDRMLLKAHAEESADVRVQDYIAAERFILAQAPIVPIGSFISYWVAQDRVQGIGFDILGGFDADQISIVEE